MTSWEEVRTFCDMCHGAEPMRLHKNAPSLLYTMRTTSTCPLGKIIIPAQLTDTQRVDTQGHPIYQYVVYADKVFRAVSDDVWKICQQHIVHTPTIRWPKVFSLAPQSITRAYICIHGNPMERVDAADMPAIRRYLGIGNNSAYLPLMCYQHYLPMAHYGNTIITFESTERVENAAIELEYSMICSDILSPTRAAKKQQESQFEWDVAIPNAPPTVIPNKPLTHLPDVMLNNYRDPLDTPEFDLNKAVLDDFTFVYFPQWYRSNSEREFRASCTPVLTILTDETENSTLELNHTELPSCKLRFASARPGVYHLQPYDNNKVCQSLRRANSEYLLGRGTYTVNKPIVGTIRANYIIATAGMVGLRFST